MCWTMFNHLDTCVLVFWLWGQCFALSLEIVKRIVDFFVRERMDLWPTGVVMGSSTTTASINIDRHWRNELLATRVRHFGLYGSDWTLQEAMSPNSPTVRLNLYLSSWTLSYCQHELHIICPRFHVLILTVHFPLASFGLAFQKVTVPDLW